MGEAVSHQTYRESQEHDLQAQNGEELGEDPSEERVEIPHWRNDYQRKKAGKRKRKNNERTKAGNIEPMTPCLRTYAPTGANFRLCRKATKDPPSELMTSLLEGSEHCKEIGESSTAQSTDGKTGDSNRDSLDVTEADADVNILDQSENCKEIEANNIKFISSK